MNGTTSFGSVECIVERGAIVPFEVVGEFTKLLLNDVKITSIDPVVPEVHNLQGPRFVHQKQRVELLRPWRRYRLRLRLVSGGDLVAGEEDDEEDDEGVDSCGNHVDWDNATSELCFRQMMMITHSHRNVYNSDIFPRWNILLKNKYYIFNHIFMKFFHFCLPSYHFCLIFVVYSTKKKIQI